MADRPTPPLTTTQEAILRRLLAAAGNPVSGELMSQEIGVTRAAIARAIDGLRDLGYGIESVRHRGHTLVARSPLLLPFEVGEGLTTAALGRAAHHFRETGSTQTVARQLAGAGAPHGTLVIAGAQTSGRGRLGRAYHSPPGGIWCTVVLRGDLAPQLAPLTGLAAGVAVAEAVREVAGLPALLKWPNDVLVGDRKVCGILSELVAEEQAIHYLLIGTGINVAFAVPEELAERATTLEGALGGSVDRRRLLQRYLERLEQLFDALGAGDGEVVTRAWLALPNSIGRRVRAEFRDHVVEGIARDLTPDGALLVETAGGERVTVSVGDVIHVPALPEIPG